MNAISFIYTGYYYLYLDSGLSSKPNFSAWAACSLSAIFYVFALLLLVGKLYDSRFGEGGFPFGVIAVVCAVAIVWVSDWNIEHTWFGAHKIEMSDSTRRLAKAVSLGLMLGSWLCFIGVGFAIYY